MRAPIQLQCIFSYTILANPEVEPHAPDTYQSKLLPGVSINSNKCEVILIQAMNNKANFQIFPPLFGDNSLHPDCNTIMP